jgi:ATP-GRASP peptide maturase of grasp-with-spasm system
MSKIIYIISESKDQTTNVIFDWLSYYNLEFKRIQDNFDLFEIINSYLNQELCSIYFRKSLEKKEILKTDINETIIKNHLEDELNHIIDFMFSSKGIKTLGVFGLSSLNRLKTMEIAMSYGFKVPRFCIANSKSKLWLFIQELNNPESVILKSFSDGVVLKIDDNIYSTYTEELDMNEIDSLNSDFLPSLFMEKITKLYEIRVFYLNGKFYSVCIFTQNDIHTKVDSRRGEKGVPNRIVPYKLPYEIELKLENVFAKLELNTGSIDLIYTSKGEYCFLEINPCGQFQMNSNICNYYLEREIIKFLAYD